MNILLPKLLGNKYIQAYHESYGRIPKWIPVGHKIGPDWTGKNKAVRVWTQSLSMKNE